MITNNVTWNAYKQIRKINASTLVHGCHSMLRLKRAIDGNIEYKSDAMRLGSGVHVLTLEPDAFEERYVVMPDFHLDAENMRAAKSKNESDDDRRTQSKATSYYKSKVKEFYANAGEKEPIARYEYDTALMCIEAIRSRPAMVELLEHANTELTLEGIICGVEFKGRVDGLTPTTLFDLKTTRNAERERFGVDFFRMKYDFKMAIYRELVRQSTVGLRDVKIIAQETSGDFDNCLYVLDDFTLDQAFKEVERVIERYKQALAEDYWPGCDQGVAEVPLYVPNFAMRDEEIDWTQSQVTDSDLIDDEVEAYF